MTHGNNNTEGAMDKIDQMIADIRSKFIDTDEGATSLDMRMTPSQEAVIERFVKAVLNRNRALSNRAIEVKGLSLSQHKHGRHVC